MINLSAPFLVAPYGALLQHRSRLGELADILSAFRAKAPQFRVAEGNKNPDWARLVDGMNYAKHAVHISSESVHLDMRAFVNDKEPIVKIVIAHTVAIDNHPLAPDVTDYAATRARLGLCLEHIEAVVRAAMDPSRLLDEGADQASEALCARYTERLSAIAAATYDADPKIDINAGIQISWPLPWSSLACIAMRRDDSSWSQVVDPETSALWTRDLPPILLANIYQDRTADQRDTWGIHLEPWSMDWRNDMDAVSKLRAISQLPKAVA